MVCGCYSVTMLQCYSFVVLQGGRVLQISRCHSRVQGSLSLEHMAPHLLYLSSQAIIISISKEIWGWFHDLVDRRNQVGKNLMMSFSYILPPWSYLILGSTNNVCTAYWSVPKLWWFCRIFVFGSAPSSGGPPPQKFNLNSAFVISSKEKEEDVWQLGWCPR